MDKGSDLYFAASASGAIKIGRSSNVAARIESLRCPDGGRVRLVSSLRGVGMYEKTAHRFVADHALGGEWFEGVPDVMRLVAAQSGEELLRLMGVKRRIAAPLSGPVTAKDRAELAEADRMIREGKALRQRVNTRLRQRRYRKRKSNGKS